MQGAFGYTGSLGINDIGANGHRSHHLEQVADSRPSFRNIPQKTLQRLPIVAYRVGGVLSLGFNILQKPVNLLTLSLG